AAKHAVRQRLAHWQQDSDLASVRDPQTLDRLPGDERQSWHQLWGGGRRFAEEVRGGGIARPSRGRTIGRGAPRTHRPPRMGCGPFAEGVTSPRQRVSVVAFDNNHFAGYAPETVRQLVAQLDLVLQRYIVTDVQQVACRKSFRR